MSEMKRFERRRRLSAITLLLLCTACAPAPAIVEALADPCSVTDGDTIRCGEERIRLLAIDAPELPGHCRTGRVCVPGDPDVARFSLETSIKGHPLTIERFGKDRYGRTLAIVRASGRSTSCSQLAGGNAIYVAKWDNLGAVARECGLQRGER